MRNIYPKPLQLSDPFQDWFSEALTEIVAKPKETLTLTDYNIIFYKVLHAANYEEGAYYLDGCFDFMQRRVDPFESNICPGLFHFINYHRKRLTQDQLLEPCLEAIAALLRHYTSDFELVRKGDDETGFHVVDPSLPELARYESSVFDLMDELVEYRLYEPILQSFLSWLNEDVVYKSCWWVCIAYLTKNWYSHAPNEPPTTLRKQRIINKLMDLRVFPVHYGKHLNYARDRGFGQYEERVRL